MTAPGEHDPATLGVDNQATGEEPDFVLDRMLGILAGLMVAAMMLITVVDVGGRYFFARSLPGSFEMTENLMAMIVFAALPFATAMRDHIAVTFISHVLPSWARRIQTGLIDIACATITGLMAWRLWAYADRLGQRGETTMELGISRGLIGSALAAMLALTALVFIVHAVRALLCGRNLIR